MQRNRNEPLTDSLNIDSINCWFYNEEKVVQKMTEYEILTEEQIQEYMKKYPKLDEADIIMASRICYKRRVDLDKTLEELSKV